MFCTARRMTGASFFLRFRKGMTRSTGGRAAGYFHILLCFVLTFLLLPGKLHAGGIPQNELQYPLGSTSPLGNGDYVSSNTGGLNTHFSYFIEVSPGAGNLTVDIFDPDIGSTRNGGDANDFMLGRSYNTQVRYTLLNPAGGTVATLSCSAGTTNPCRNYNNVWYQFYAAASPVPGHWEVRVDMSSAVTRGDDVNGFAVRARDTGAGTELNMYAQSFAEPGVIGAGNSATDHFYPYITSGCVFDSNDFDSDSAASISVASREGTFSQNITAVSGATDWANNEVTGWTSAISSVDYGIWSSSFSISGPGGSSGNLATFYLGNSTGGNPPPATQPQANTFRIYFPTEAGGAPVKPYVTQNLGWISGPNPPVAGSTTRVQIDVNVFNPTPWPITFSPANQVTANVPGGAVVYAGGADAAVSQGTITAQPGVGGAGNITWDPGTVDGGAAATMIYRVDVTPTAAGTIPVTGTVAASTGTTSRFLDETGTTTYTFGPLCELSVNTGTSLPTLAGISSFAAHEENGQVVVGWTTAYERNTLGFYLFRFDASSGDYKNMTQGLLPSMLSSPNGGEYSFVDREASPGEVYRYKLVEVERNGRMISYGPFTVSTGKKNGAVTGAIERSTAKASGGADLAQSSVYRRSERQQSAFRQSRVCESDAIRKSAELRGTREGDSAGTRLRIPVSDNGLYYVDAIDLSNLLGTSSSEISSMIGKNQLSVSSQGMPVPYLPSAHNAGLFFYGTGVDSVFTRDNIYWIDNAKGELMKKTEYPKHDWKGQRFSLAAGSGTFTETLHIEKDLIQNMQLNDPGADYWDWALIFSSSFYSDAPKNFSFIVSGKADTADVPAALKVHLVGGSDSGVAADHHVIVSLNGRQIGEGRWGGLNSYTLMATFSHSLLNEGDNTIEVRGVLDSGVPWSMFLIDSFDLSYQRLYRAAGNRLFFGADGNRTVTVGGFTTASPDILLFEITDPLDPEQVNPKIGGVPGNYRISFRPASPDGRYLAVAEEAVAGVQNAESVVPSNLHAADLSADYLIIAPEALAAAAEPLAAYRKAQGLETMVVTLEDIMNEFNFGLSSPEAIRQFLSYAYSNWRKAPKYVVLAGDGTWDYKDNLGAGGDLIPPALVPTANGLTTSDNALADVNGDYLPEMAIGRLPVLVPQDLENVISKIKTFEGNRSNRAILLADNPDEGGDFTGDTEEIAALFPSDYVQEKVYMGDLSFDAAKTMLSAYLDGGAEFFNYIGHGGLDMLSKSAILSSSEDYPDALQVDSLMNGNGPPVMLAMTCAAGDFAVPGYLSLSEAMVLKGAGGAVAAWSSAGLSDNSEAKILNGEFYRAIFPGGERSLGDAILQALSKYRESGTEPFMMDIYTLLGDPALRLR